MFLINKALSSETVDFAAQELKKYLRMMMPECGDVKIVYNPMAKDGFRLGLMQDFGLDVSDAESTELDDIIYIDCDTSGGIIAGDNPRSVLLAVYEYLRQNGCRWLLPGIDGELIPTQDIIPVKYRHKPSCRYRGYSTEGYISQPALLNLIDFMPKVGLNVFMVEFKSPKVYYDWYYDHRRNEENRPPESVTDNQVMQWKRMAECEMARRGIQFHDVGHGFNTFPFGIEALHDKPDATEDELLTEETRQYMALLNGKRGFHNGQPSFTNFCMSNPAARKKVAEYVADYSKKHLNVDHLHVWLADGTNNYCECDECKKKIPADWYMTLLNDIDDVLSAEGLPTRIVFISYVDTTWAPKETRLNNPNRFTLLFAPIFRSYSYSMPNGRGNTKLVPYKLNQNVFPDSLAASLDYFDEWKKTYNGAAVAFEYHFWRHAAYDLTQLHMSKIVHDDIKIYKNNGINGVIQNGTLRTFFPNGLSFYTYARTMFDIGLSYDEILEDYFSHAYGEDWKDFHCYLRKLEEAIPFDFLSIDRARERKSVYYNPDFAKKVEDVRRITTEARDGLIKEHYNTDYRVRTVMTRLLEYHAEYCDLVSDWLAAKARGETEHTEELYERARITFGKREAEIEFYYDSCKISAFWYCERLKSPGGESAIFQD